MTKKEKLPGGLEKELQKLVGKSERTVGDIQKTFLDELKNNIRVYKIIGYNVKKYERQCNKIQKKRSKFFLFELREKDDYFLKPTKH